MKVFWFSLSIFFLFHLPGTAQLHFNATSGAYSNALGGASIHLTHMDGAFNNQSGLAEMDQFGFILGSEVRFLIEDLAAVGIGVAFPIQKIGTVGIVASNLGFDAYREQKIGVAYARKLSSKINLGAQIDYLNTTIENFGSRGLVTAEIGFQINIGEKYKLSTHIFSPAKISLLDEYNDINSRIRVGGQYMPSETISIIIEVDKWLLNPVSVHGGINYNISDQLSFRIGASTNPGLFSIGIGYAIGGRIGVDGGYTYYQEIGSTPSFSIKSQ